MCLALVLCSVGSPLTSSPLSEDCFVLDCFYSFPRWLDLLPVIFPRPTQLPYSRRLWELGDVYPSLYSALLSSPEDTVEFPSCLLVSTVGAVPRLSFPLAGFCAWMARAVLRSFVFVNFCLLYLQLKDSVAGATVLFPRTWGPVPHCLCSADFGRWILYLPGWPKNLFLKLKSVPQPGCLFVIVFCNFSLKHGMRIWAVDSQTFCEIVPSILDPLGSTCWLGSLFWGSQLPLCLLTAAHDLPLILCSVRASPASLGSLPPVSCVSLLSWCFDFTRLFL